MGDWLKKNGFFILVCKPSTDGVGGGKMKILILPLKKYATSEEKRQYAEEVASAKRHYNSLGIECVEFVEPDPISDDELVKTLWKRGHLYDLGDSQQQHDVTWSEIVIYGVVVIA